MSICVRANAGILFPHWHGGRGVQERPLRQGLRTGSGSSLHAIRPPAMRKKIQAADRPVEIPPRRDVACYGSTWRNFNGARPKPTEKPSSFLDNPLPLNGYFAVGDFSRTAPKGVEVDAGVQRRYIDIRRWVRDDSVLHRAAAHVGQSYIDRKNFSRKVNGQVVCGGIGVDARLNGISVSGCENELQGSPILHPADGRVHQLTPIVLWGGNRAIVIRASFSFDVFSRGSVRATSVYEGCPAIVLIGENLSAIEAGGFAHGVIRFLAVVIGKPTKIRIDYGRQHGPLVKVGKWSNDSFDRIDA